MIVVDCNFKATSKIEISVKQHEFQVIRKRVIITREGYKSERWMPRLLEAKKDVVSCEKRRGTANRF